MKIRIAIFWQLFAVLGIMFFFYWIYYDMSVWNKTFGQVNLTNIIMTPICAVLLVIGFKYRKRLPIINIGETNPSKKQPADMFAGFRKAGETTPPTTQEKRSVNIDFRGDLGRSTGERKIYKMPFLRRIKRYMAIGILLFDTVLLFSTLTNPSTAIMSLIFLLNGFIILDYLWKTRLPTLFERIKKRSKGEQPLKELIKQAMKEERQEEERKTSAKT